jgi:uncharacterized protein (TIGR03905 family)
MKVVYIPKGVCSKKMTVVIENGILQKVTVLKGCSGNLQGICRLLIGMEANEAIKKLKGIHCGKKTTSCPDQLARALKKSLRSQAALR